MTLGQISWMGIAVLALLGYFLNGNGDPDVWAALFWASAIGNFVLVLVLADLRRRYGGK